MTASSPSEESEAEIILGGMTARGPLTFDSKKLDKNVNQLSELWLGTHKYANEQLCAVEQQLDKSKHKIRKYTSKLKELSEKHEANMTKLKTTQETTAYNACGLRRKTLRQIASAKKKGKVMNMAILMIEREIQRINTEFRKSDSAGKKAFQPYQADWENAYMSLIELASSMVDASESAKNKSPKKHRTSPKSVTDEKKEAPVKAVSEEEKKDTTVKPVKGKSVEPGSTVKGKSHAYSEERKASDDYSHEPNTYSKKRAKGPPYWTISPTVDERKDQMKRLSNKAIGWVQSVSPDSFGGEMCIKRDKSREVKAAWRASGSYNKSKHFFDRRKRKNVRCEVLFLAQGLNLVVGIKGFQNHSLSAHLRHNNVHFVNKQCTNPNHWSGGKKTGVAALNLLPGDILVCDIEYSSIAPARQDRYGQWHQSCKHKAVNARKENGDKLYVLWEKCDTCAQPKKSMFCLWANEDDWRIPYRPYTQY